MMDYSKFPNRQIACIDMMSFYASCMASLHNLDVRTVPIAVVGNLKQKGSRVGCVPTNEKTVSCKNRHAAI